MNTNKLFSSVIYLVVSIFILTSSLKAQTPSNFNGNWELDKTKSKLSETDASYPGTRILHISQTSSMLIMNSTYIQPGNADFNTSNDTLNLEGKVKIEKVSDQTRTITVSWSPDKKILTYKNSSMSNSSGSGIVMLSYKLSDDKQTLTVEMYGKNKVREIKSTEVYSKK
jgi:hypothetical protein